MCFPKKMMSDQTSAQHGKLHDLKTTINYLQVEIILEDRTLERHNMFDRRDEVHKKKKI